VEGGWIISLQLPSTIWVATAPINLRLSFDRSGGRGES
jgi:hypothetical protein